MGKKLLAASFLTGVLFVTAAIEIATRPYEIKTIAITSRSR